MITKIDFSKRVFFETRHIYIYIYIYLYIYIYIYIMCVWRWLCVCVCGWMGGRARHRRTSPRYMGWRGGLSFGPLARFASCNQGGTFPEHVHVQPRATPVQSIVSVVRRPLDAASVSYVLDRLFYVAAGVVDVYFSCFIQLTDVMNSLGREANGESDNVLRRFFVIY